MKKIKAMFIDAGSCEVRIAWIPDVLEVYQEYVGGFIECVNVSPKDVMIVNDEGLMCDLKANTIATMIYWTAIGHPATHIAGNAVIVGRSGEDFADISPSMIFKINKILTALRASESSGPAS